MEHGMDMIREISTSNTQMGMGDVVCREKVRHSVARNAPPSFSTRPPASSEFRQGTKS
jgi:hypothetical protein